MRNRPDSQDAYRTRNSSEDGYWRLIVTGSGDSGDGSNLTISARYLARLASIFEAPPAGFEPALTAPEAVALSPELWGLRDVGKITSDRTLPGHAAR